MWSVKSRDPLAKLFSEFGSDQGVKWGVRFTDLTVTPLTKENMTSPKTTGK